MDTTLATESDRLKIYLNGERITDFSTASYPPQDTLLRISDSAFTHTIWEDPRDNVHFDGYLSNLNFIDWQALTPSSFWEFDSTTGQWIPKDYSGTYGTNGFHLDFRDGSNLGKDVSGNGNNWTVNNMDATDQMLDSPENNFATWNPLRLNSISLSDWNLSAVWTSNWLGTLSFSEKSYYEFYVTTTNSIYTQIWVSNLKNESPKRIAYGANGQLYITWAWRSYGSSRASWDTIGIAVDPFLETVEYFKNNVSQGVKSLSSWEEYIPYVYSNTANFWTANFGQGWQTGLQDCADAWGKFKYCPPTGFKALSTANLPTPTIADPSNHFDVITYTGNWGTKTITGLNFQPDLVWSKWRNNSNSHRVCDSVRWVWKYIMPDDSWAEYSENWLTSFNSDGFTLWSWWNYNTNNTPYVAWLWNASWTTVTNNDWSTTSQVRTNPTAGFSIVSYTGNWASSLSWWHGLNKTPEMVIVKSRTNWQNWMTWHKGLWWPYYLTMDWNWAKYTWTIPFANTVPDSTKVYVWENWWGRATNESWQNYIAYNFHSVPGYSKVWSYTGNWSADWPFVYTGFKPKYVMVKSSTSTEEWMIIDGKRNINNPSNNRLFANFSSAEDANDALDLLSNWFKMKRAWNWTWNVSWQTYIYIAFAEAPFKYATAR